MDAGEEGPGTCEEVEGVVGEGNGFLAELEASEDVGGDVSGVARRVRHGPAKPRGSEEHGERGEGDGPAKTAAEEEGEGAGGNEGESDDAGKSGEPGANAGEGGVIVKEGEEAGGDEEGEEGLGEEVGAEEDDGGGGGGKEDEEGGTFVGGSHAAEEAPVEEAAAREQRRGRALSHWGWEEMRVKRARMAGKSGGIEVWGMGVGRDSIV